MGKPSNIMEMQNNLRLIMLKLYSDGNRRTAALVGRWV